MKILHTADLHLGQIIYQNYNRTDEHTRYFEQLAAWCRSEQPDALVVSGDVFDVPQPATAVVKNFIDTFLELHDSCPDMKIVIIAGNHDSASRLQVDSGLWSRLGATVIGVPPSSVADDNDADSNDRYIVRLTEGYIVAMPYSIGDRREAVQKILDVIAAENTGNLPVVVAAHAAVTGADITGHSTDIGTLRSLPPEAFGVGYDYLALGHIHRPQTIGHPADDEKEPESCYDAPVARYSGSALHVSCDERYPHSVSTVEIDRHGGRVKVRRLHIDELRHFHILPADGSAFATADEAIAGVRRAVTDGLEGYFRLRIDIGAALPPDFNKQIYDIIAPCENTLRFNPKHLWEGTIPDDTETETPVFEVAELQQMTDPMEFVERTASRYSDFTLDELREAFREIADEAHRLEEEAAKKTRK